MMTIEETLAYIDSYYFHKTEPGLGRIRALLARLGDPQQGLRCVHVAGTNGKGSTSAMLESMLRAAGYKTGLFTSPHLVRFHERMQCCGACITDAELIELTQAAGAAAESLSEPVNEFELITAIAFLWFARQNCEIVVLEVGLGGEFDATNVIGCPECAVICNIGLDHTAVLGGTVEKIAAAKAGIIKAGGMVVLYPNTPGVERVVREKCAAVGAVLKRADFAALRPLAASLDGQCFSYGALRELSLPLAGEHQLKNAAVALTAVEVLRRRGWRISESALRKGLSAVQWPARLQIAGRDPLFLIDGGHNAQCIEALIENLRQLLPATPLIFLVGILSDKDSEEMGERLGALAAEFVVVAPHSTRAIPAAALGALLGRAGQPVTVCESVRQAVDAARARARARGGAVCCTGSLYLAGDVLRLLTEE